MASIFKLGKDKRRKGAVYHIEYVDHLGKTRRKKGFSDKGLTQQLAAKIEREVMLRLEGLIDPKQDQLAAQRTVSLTEHVAQFKISLSQKGSTANHVRKTVSRIERIINDAGMESIGDIEPESVEEALQEMLVTDEIGHRTYNHYLQAIDSFCRWMTPKRMAFNPLTGIHRLNTEVDIRRKRRALSPQEMARLLESARTSGTVIECFDGELRARLYFTSFLTGLRRRELGSLTPQSFDLDAKLPVIVVEAACSKHRKKDTLPIHPELMALLKEWLPTLKADEHLFPRIERRRSWRMVRRDLERIGIPYENEEGVADFHAAGRHSYVTGLLLNGVGLVQAKELARHSDVKMTMRYAHVGLAEQTKSLKSLPAPTTVRKGKEETPVSASVSKRGGSTCPPLTSADTNGQGPKHLNPGEGRGLGDDCHRLSSDGDDCLKRREGDSNPRYGCPHTAFPVLHNRPLCHLSGLSEN